jgi:hypothetical protein
MLKSIQLLDPKLIPIEQHSLLVKDQHQHTAESIIKGPSDNASIQRTISMHDIYP